MQTKLLAQSQYKIMPWKNGMGITAQIDIFPEATAFPEGEYMWRVSSATIGASSAFSKFPGCDRWLVVLKGEGLLLNGKKLEPLTPLHFSGEDDIQCDLVGSEVLDLGIIYRRDRVKASLSVADVPAGANLDFSEDGYLYCFKGQLESESELIQVGDTLRVQAPLRLESKSGATVIWISVTEI